LIDKPLGRLLPIRGGKCQRRTIQKPGNPQVKINVTRLNGALADDYRDAIENHRGRRIERQ
jgi:hypothetical protein